MRVLSVHNFYLQGGGEDTVFRLEAELLRRRGHEVIEYTEDNRRIAQMSAVSVAVQTVWSWNTYSRLRTLIQNTRPDIAHFHNFFPLISPAAYYACHEMGVPVVQTLHNQRLMCPAASFFRRGRLCLDCLGKSFPWPGVLHACYHRSRVHTLVVSLMVWWHWRLKTWQQMVDAYINSTHFYRELFIQAGFSPHKLKVKPHFVFPPSAVRPLNCIGDYVLFVGRLETVKGIETLLTAWGDLSIPLKVRGSGPLETQIRRMKREGRLQSVEVVGRLTADALSRLFQRARFVVVPSVGYYETFGMVVIEAYSHGVPVLAAQTGVMEEMVLPGETGIFFAAGDANDLLEKARWLWSNPEAVRYMGRQAHRLYQERFSPEPSYQTLLQIYDSVIA